MSLAHTKVAWKCAAAGVFRGNTLLMLLALSHKAGTGKPLANGHVIPLGQVRLTDKQLMKLLGTRRRASVWQWRKKLAKTGVISWDIVPNTYKGKSTWPVHLYQLNLERMEELLSARQFSSHRRL